MTKTQKLRGVSAGRLKACIRSIILWVELRKSVWVLGAELSIPTASEEQVIPVSRIPRPLSRVLAATIDCWSLWVGRKGASHLSWLLLCHSPFTLLGALLFFDNDLFFVQVVSNTLAMDLSQTWTNPTSYSCSSMHAEKYPTWACVIFWHVPMHSDGQHGMRSLASLSEALKGRGETGDCHAHLGLAVEIVIVTTWLL